MPRSLPKTDRTSPARLLLLGLAPALLLGGCEAKKAEEAASAEPTAASSEWVAENPTEPAVPVTLPDTAVTSAPVDTATASPAAK